jgi:hypothetical protein
LPLSKLARAAAGATFLTALIACSSNNGSGGGSEANVTFTQVYTQILGPTCSVHHSGAAPSGNLDMSTQSLAYQHLVGVAAQGLCGDEDPVPQRVIAYDHADSLLWQKVMGLQKCGVQMPANGPPYLTTAQTDLIAEWIDDGAQND